MKEKKFRCDENCKNKNNRNSENKTTHKRTNKFERIKRQTPYSHRTCMTIRSKQNDTDRVAWSTLLRQTRAGSWATKTTDSPTNKNKQQRRAAAAALRDSRDANARSILRDACIPIERAKSAWLYRRRCASAHEHNDQEKTAQKQVGQCAKNKRATFVSSRHSTCNSTRTRKQVSPHKRCVALQADRETRNNNACRIVEQRTNKLRNRSTIAQRQRLK